ncbi:MAG: GntR family transcriptional regulator, partial [Ruminococcus sp.]|nr:GntR family transcriptional regulator [Ruminococcus sp.]
KSYLLLKGINYDERDREMLYALEYVDTDLIKFNQIRKKVITYS